MARARWLHVFTTFSVGGAQMRATQLMNALGPSIEHVIVSTYPDQMAAKELLGVHVAVETPDFPSFHGPSFLQRQQAFAKALREGDYDLVLTYNWGSIELVLANLWGAQLPLIHHEDGFGPDEMHTTLLRRDLFRRVAFHGASAVVACSRRIEAIARRQWGLSRQKVHFLPNGVDLAAFEATPAPTAIPGFVKQPGDILIGTVAGLRPEKNLPRLVRAFASASREWPAATLVIVGQGPEEGTIRAEADRLGVANRVILPGYLPKPGSYVGLFDIFALSSDTEQFPISLIEAMAARLPVACTNVGDIADIVADESLPYLVSKGDERALAQALSTLMADAELRRTLGHANYAKVAKNFSQARMVDSYAELYGRFASR